ncbi:MAG: rod-binding protein [Betaproteobacteria bacterium]|jgi:flagellar protein FlgJ
MNPIERAQLAIDPQALGSLKAEARREGGEALRKVAQEFESLLLNQVMKSMRAVSFGDDISGSETTRTFTGMLDQQYVQAITRGPGLGLADLIVRQVEHARPSAIKDGGPVVDNTST